MKALCCFSLTSKLLRKRLPFKIPRCLPPSETSSKTSHKAVLADRGTQKPTTPGRALCCEDLAGTSASGGATRNVTVAARGLQPGKRGGGRQPDLSIPFGCQPVPLGSLSGHPAWGRVLRSHAVAQGPAALHWARNSQLRPHTSEPELGLLPDGLRGAQRWARPVDLQGCLSPARALALLVGPGLW